MTAPAHKQLGETTNAKELVPGNVEQITANVTKLDTEYQRIDGLYGRISAVRVEGWSGEAQAGWEGLYDAETERWKAYLKHLKTVKDAISTYSGAVTTAQGDAQRAIDKWAEGEAETEAAVKTYNEAVAAYNSSQCVPIPPGQTVVRPSPPGLFVDPGVAKRKEAEEILEGAREELDSAGETALGKLRNADGGLDDASWDWWGIDKGASGPKVKFPWDKSTEDDKKWGTDPEDSAWEISAGEFHFNPYVWKGDATWEDYYGPLKVGAEGETFGGAELSGSAKLDGTGGHAGGEAFVGAKIKGGLDANVGPVGGGVDVEGWAGAGISGNVDVGWDDGKFKLGGHAGAGWGLGGKIGGDVEIDVGGIVDTVGGWLP